MSTPRQLSAPDDINNYPDNRLVYRKVAFKPGHPQAPLPSGGGVVEAAWGNVYNSPEDSGALKHPAESVSFSENSDGGWDKSTSLRLGDVGPQDPRPERPILEAKTLTWDQFLDVAMATDATKTNTTLVNMPVIAEYGRKYANTAGIEYADASTPGTRLSTLMAAAKQAGLINDQFLATFLATWKARFP
jgi:hypothetical protein